MQAFPHHSSESHSTPSGLHSELRALTVYQRGWIPPVIAWWPMTKCKDRAAGYHSQNNSRMVKQGVLEEEKGWPSVTAAAPTLICCSQHSSCPNHQWCQNHSLPMQSYRAKAVPSYWTYSELEMNEKLIGNNKRLTWRPLIIFHDRFTGVFAIQHTSKNSNKLC